MSETIAIADPHGVPSPDLHDAESQEQPSTGRFSDYVGLKMVERGVGHAVIELEVEPKHHNRLGVAHGGAILAAMDLACGMSVVEQEDPDQALKTMTINLNTSFVAPIRSGRMIVTGTRVRIGRSIAFCEAVAKTESGKLIAKAQGTFKVINRNQRDTKK